jgi:HEAT repeat protein
MTLNSAVPHLLVITWALYAATAVSAAQATTPAQEKDPLQAARTSAQRSLEIGDVARALQTYETLRDKDPSHAELLRSIAVTRAMQLRKDADARVRVGACAAIFLVGADRSCIDELTTLANDTSLDMGSRFAAANALRAAKVAGSDRLFEYLLGQAVEQSPATAADTLARLPSAVSREPLKRLAADSPNADARYIAAMALSRMRGDDLIPVLRLVSNDKSAGAARLPAAIGLARNGDPEGLKILNDTLPYIRGRERTEAALTLVALKDPRGTTLLAEVAKGEHDLARLDAAEAMHASRPKEAEAILADALKSDNPWIRARAFDAASSVGLRQTAVHRQAMLHHNAAVAVAAVRAAILDASKPRQ